MSFSGLWELALLHTLTHIPVDKGPLGVHQIELVIETSPGLSNSCGVAQHAHGPLYFSQITTWNHSGRLVVDANLETSGTPIHKLDGTLGLDGGDCSVHIFGHHVTTVQQAASHVLAVTWVAFYHLIGWFEASISDFRHWELLMVSLLCRDHWGIGSQWEVDTRIGHQVGLETLWDRTLRAPSNLREAVMEDTIWLISLLRLV